METNRSSECEEVRECLSAYVDGETTKAERSLVERHLVICGECRDRHAEIVRLVERLGKLPRTEASPAYLEALRERLEGSPTLGDRLADLFATRPAVYRLSFSLGAVICAIALAPYLLDPSSRQGRSYDDTADLAQAQRAESAAPAQASPVVVARAPEPASRPSVQGDPTAGLPTATGVGLAKIGTGPVGAQVLQSVKATLPQLSTRAKVLGPKIETDTEPASPVFAAATGSGKPAIKPAQPPSALRVSPLVARLPRDDVAAGQLPDQGRQAATGQGETDLDLSSAAGEVGRRGAPRGLLEREGARAFPSGEAAPATVGVGEWNPRGGGETRVEKSVSYEKLGQIVGSKAELARGAEAESVAARAGSADIQVFATDPAEFVREAILLVNDLQAFSVRRVLVLTAPAIEIHLAYTGSAQDRSLSVRMLKEGIGGLSTVKATATDGPERTTGETIRIRVPLAQPVGR